MNINKFAFTQAILPEDWKIPECFNSLEIYGNTSLKRVTIPESDIFLKIHPEADGTFHGCTNLEAAVIPASVSYSSAFTEDAYIELFGGDCGTDALTVYVGDFSKENELFKSLKAHAYEDYTGDTVVKYKKTTTSISSFN